MGSRASSGVTMAATANSLPLRVDYPPPHGRLSLVYSDPSDLTRSASTSNEPRRPKSIYIDLIIER